jgi:RNA polymerase sigma-70 factor (ECF subfamily)
MTKAHQETDEQLVELVRNVDQELFTHLVSRYQSKLTRYANYLTRDQAMSQDVVQSAFIKAFQNLYGFNTNKKFSSWIYRITHNEAMNYLKKNSKEQQLEPSHWKNIADDTNIEKAIGARKIAQLVTDNLEKIPVKYRSVLTLYYLEEKKYEEISDILRISMGTVATWISRGKKSLKKELLNSGIKGGIDDKS